MPTIRDFFERYSIPQLLQDVLLSNSFDRSIKIGHLYYSRVRDIEIENIEEQNLNCINSGLLIIGSGLNGDPIVFDIQTWTIGFIFHDELWEDGSVEARDVYINTGLSFGEFYFNAAAQRETFPVDAYQAEAKYGK